MKNNNPFIVAYSRADAIADGVQLEANPKTRAEAGIKYPVFLTEAVFNRYVKVPETFEHMQDEDARLWDIFTMFRFYLKLNGGDSNFLEFKLSVFMSDKTDWLPNEKPDLEFYDGEPTKTQRLVTLHSTIGPTDFNNPAPAITIFIPGED